MLAPFQGRLLAIVMSSAAACGNHSGPWRKPFRARAKTIRLPAGITVRLQPGILFVFTPERFSRSLRNPVRLAPESALVAHARDHNRRNPSQRSIRRVKRLRRRISVRRGRTLECTGWRPADRGDLQWGQYAGWRVAHGAALERFRQPVRRKWRVGLGRLRYFFPGRSRQSQSVAYSDHLREPRARLLTLGFNKERPTHLKLTLSVPPKESRHDVKR
jgi:hypothetical protein